MSSRIIKSSDVFGVVSASELKAIGVLSAWGNQASKSLDIIKDHLLKMDMRALTDFPNFLLFHTKVDDNKANLIMVYEMRKDNPIMWLCLK
jgi:hypothetical protein